MDNKEMYGNKYTRPADETVVKAAGIEWPDRPGWEPIVAFYQSVLSERYRPWHRHFLDQTRKCAVAAADDIGAITHEDVDYETVASFCLLFDMVGIANRDGTWLHPQRHLHFHPCTDTWQHEDANRWALASQSLFREYSGGSLQGKTIVAKDITEGADRGIELILEAAGNREAKSIVFTDRAAARTVGDSFMIADYHLQLQTLVKMALRQYLNASNPLNRAHRIRFEGGVDAWQALLLLSQERCASSAEEARWFLNARDSERFEQRQVKDKPIASRLIDDEDRKQLRLYPRHPSDSFRDSHGQPFDLKRSYLRNWTTKYPDPQETFKEL
jgi:hypothetical protein